MAAARRRTLVYHRRPEPVPTMSANGPSTLNPAQMEAVNYLRGPCLVLAGAAYRGIGIPDCIRDGAEAARGLVRLFTGGRSA